MRVPSSIATVATDTYANSNKPDERYGSSNVVVMRAAVTNAYVRPPFPQECIGRVILSAELAGHVAPGWLAQQVAVRLVGEAWKQGTVTWNRRPPFLAGVTTTATPALSDGGRVSLDVTGLVQSIADGTEWNGFRLSTDGTATQQRFWSSNSGRDAWEFAVEWSDSPEQAENLRPSGGAVASPTPILTWDASGQTAFHVRIFSTEDALTPVWSSGWIMSSQSRLDLSATSYLGGGGWWEVSYRSARGGPADSTVSDRVQFTVTPVSPVVLDAPTGGVVTTATPTVTAHLASGTVARWQMMITGESRSDIRADSDVQDGPVASWQVPAAPDKTGWPVLESRYHVDDSVLVEGETRQLGILLWDDEERVDAEGDQTHVELWTDITWDETVALEVPSNLTVEQLGAGPLLRWRWERSSTSSIQILVDDRMVRTVPESQIQTVAGVHTWDDDGWLAPLWPVQVAIRAEEDDGDRSRKSAPVAANLNRVVEGTWLVADGEPPVELLGADLESLSRVDPTAVFELTNGNQVHYRHGRGPLAGELSFNLSVGSRTPEGGIYESLRILDRIASRPRRPRSVRLVGANLSIPVIIDSLHTVPHNSLVPNVNDLYVARMTVVQDR